MTLTLSPGGKRFSKLAATVASVAALAAPLHASAAPTLEFAPAKFKTSSLDCASLIASAKSATSRHGMDVDSISKDSLKASSPSASFSLTCTSKFASVQVSDGTGGQTDIEIASGDVSTVSIIGDFSSGAFLSKEFSFNKRGEGTQEHFAVSSDGAAAAMSSPISAKSPSKSEFTVSFGVPARVNGEFMVADIHAKHWTIATDLQMAWSGLDSAMEAEGGAASDAQTALFAYQARPLPANGDTQDSDHGNTNKVCAAGAAACVAGLLGVITAGACAAGGVACLAAAACEAADCSDDGYN